MNRLQKKCLIATAGFHLLLIVILIVGPGFFTEKPKPDNTPVLQEISADKIDEVLNSGVANAQPPPPAPAIVTPPQPVQQPAPTPPAPEPTPQPPTPAPQPAPTPPVVKPVEPVDPTPITPAPDDDPKPVEHKHVKPVKPVEHKAKPTTEHKINLVPVTRTAPTDSSAQNAQAVAQREARRAAREQANAINNAINNLKSNFSTATKVEMPGTSSVSYASYAAIIKAKYTQAWTPPNNAANDEANVKVKVTVGSDGTVISAHIMDASGDSSVDDSIQRTLDRVDFIAPFPDGATEKTKTFIINFNLKAKQMLG